MSHARFCTLSLALTGALALAACDEATSGGSPAPSDDVRVGEASHVDWPERTNEAVQRDDAFLLSLDTDNGESATGWSFAQDAVVPREQADIVLFGSGCRGAVGVYVSSKQDDVDVCLSDASGIGPDLDTCGWSVLAGGNLGTEIDVGDVFFVRVNSNRSHAVELVDRTEYPSDASNASAVGFEMVLSTGL